MYHDKKLAVYYRINGSIYIRKIEYGHEDIRLLDDKEIAFIMDKRRSVDIDDAFDFAVGEFLVGNKDNY